jgi:3-phenylpropionate/trans-cinnamate dioxygenase ferredoxin subunit
MWCEGDARKHSITSQVLPVLVKMNRPHKEQGGVVVEGPMYFKDRRPDLPLPLPSDDAAHGANTSDLTPDKDGWVSACAADEVTLGDVARFDVGPRTYCVYHAEDDGKFYATAGTCTHGAALLAEGLVTGNLIECPKHNGCFDFKTGLPKRLPVKKALATFPTKVRVSACPRLAFRHDAIAPRPRPQVEGGIVFVKVADGKHVQLAFEEDAR